LSKPSVVAYNIVDDQGNVIDQCWNNQCTQPIATIPVSPGTYSVTVQLYTKRFRFICETDQEIIVPQENFKDSNRASQGRSRPTYSLSKVFLEEAFTIYPNPVNNLLKVEFTKHFGLDGELILYNSLGGIAKRFPLGEIKNLVYNLTLDNMDSGMYYLQFRVGNKVISTEKLVVEQ